MGVEIGSEVRKSRTAEAVAALGVEVHHHETSFKGTREVHREVRRVEVDARALAELDGPADLPGDEEFVHVSAGFSEQSFDARRPRLGGGDRIGHGQYLTPRST